MYKSPELATPRVEMIFPEGAKKLWLRALQRPEVETKCKAADAIARAHRLGVEGLQAAVAPLQTLLDQPEEHPSVLLAAVRALAELDGREAAETLFRHAQTGDSDLREAIEPVLARWDYRPIRAVWLDRVGASAPRARDLVLAIRGLATVGEVKAIEPLRAMVLSERVAACFRLEAARALARLRVDGLEQDATALSANQSPAGVVARLAAASLLQRHSSAMAVQLLQRLIQDDEPAVSALAIERLLELDARLLVPSIDPILANRDAKVRALGVEVLFREPTQEHLERLREQLNDVHPEVRSKARRSLYELASKKELRERVVGEAVKALRTEQWRSLEQASILLTQFDHKPSAGRFVALLSHSRPEVFVAAAWGLRKLAVAATLPAVVAHIEARVIQLSGGAGQAAQMQVPSDMIDHELSQLNQFLGQQKYTAADGLLRRFVPQPRMGMSVGHESRAAAIWALGLIHDGTNVPALAAALEERLNHTAMPIPPEDRRVRWMSALTLGRLRAKHTLPSLRRHCPQARPEDDPVNNACGWAIELITGERMPPPRTVRKPQRDWFLVPRE
jgi:hypothetical protein